MEPVVAVLIDDAGVHVGDAAGPGPPSLLQRLGNGAYTAALVRGGRTDAGGASFRIVDWHLHERRLLRSVGRGGLHQGSGGLPPGEVSGQWAGGAFTRGAASIWPGQWSGKTTGGATSSEGRGGPLPGCHPPISGATPSCVHQAGIYRGRVGYGPPRITSHTYNGGWP